MMKMSLDDVKQKMAKAMEFVKQEVATVRTGKANASLVENLTINAYGGTAKMRVMEVAMISNPEPHMLVLAPYDQSIIGDIRRDVEAANIGVQPVIDNEVIRLTFPPLSAERRLEYVKLLHVKLEDGRVKMRQIRHEKMSEIKREFEAGTVSEDERKRLEKELQEITDKQMGEIETIGKAKEEELLKV